MAITAAFAMLLLLWPALLGLFISLAIVGKGLRLMWLPLALGIFVVFAAVLSAIWGAVRQSDPSGLFDAAAIYVSGALLIPAGHFFKKRRPGFWGSRMTVIDHEPSGWFLVRDGERLLLDVNCSHSAASYQFLMELNASERAAYAAHGHAFISELAEKIQYSAPGVLGTTSPYRERILRGADPAAVDAVTIAWVQKRGGAL
jgi:hypothetical protein